MAEWFGRILSPQDQTKSNKNQAEGGKPEGADSCRQEPDLPRLNERVREMR